ncbi:MAG TPA: hypothetical protein VJ698_19290 [Noviherbaspirillum sp.]|uniref:hypothetical protein n=1 Tax=Noviherbaspirillum sp. TaxID=1926288 RepID=UPI002B48DEF6|nr:hypothetical protein [Noviherbaspirillum sp.]HJV87622.1 hypothetical protein [Noviherbaspirillum sp.]
MEKTDLVTDTSLTKNTSLDDVNPNDTGDLVLENEIKSDTSAQHAADVEQSAPTAERADTETSNTRTDNVASIATNQDSSPENEAGSDTNVATIFVGFRDFAFDPIEGLKYKFVADGKTIKTGITSNACHTVTLTEIIPGSEVQIFVFREHTKDFKNIGSIYAHPGDSSYAICSPKLKYILDTEEHVGEPGDAEQKRPPAPEESGEQKKDGVSASSARLPATPSQGIDVAPSPSHGESKTATSPVQKIATTRNSQQNKPNITLGRDSAGHPQANVEDMTLDWLKRKILAVFNFWSWRDFEHSVLHPPRKTSSRNSAASREANKQATDGSQIAKPGKSAQGHSKINPLVLRPVIFPTNPLSGKELDRLQKLIDFVEHQVKLDYSPYRGKGGTTVNVINAYAKTNEPTFENKDPNRPKGLCQVYVKVALFKAGYTNGPGWEGQAKTSGKDWLKYGFSDVSSTLPQVEITYEDALSPTDWPQAEQCLKNAAALKTPQRDGEKQKKLLTAKEIETAEKTSSAVPVRKKEVKYMQPDLMYTLPGDVIVYEQVDPVELDPPGHVDIRTYHGFISDFVWPAIPSLGGPAKSTKRYRVTGVFRKFSDTLALVRVQAFLRILREHEAKGFKDPYHALRYSPSERPSHITFNDFSTHPYAEEKKNKPAGAYQIKLQTWEEVTKKMIGWPKDFSPSMQDRISILLLHRRPYSSMPHPRRSALGYIMEGRIEEAINKTGLSNEWSCLPGGRDSQMKMGDLKILFDQYVQECMK